MLTRLLLAVTSTGLLAVSALAADTNAEKTRKLIEVLQSNAAFYEKARACQQLSEFGTRDAVPALAALLGDEHLCAYARSGLEGIPDPSAAEALRNAATKLTGDRLAGVVESLGVLRDTNAVDLLHKMAGDPAPGVSHQAVLALGRIANQAAIRILRENLARETSTRTNAAAACLIAAEKQIADGHADIAAALCDAVRNADVQVVYRAAAIRGAIVARKAEGVPLLVDQLQSKEPILRNAALIAIREIPCEELARALNTEINRASGRLQQQLLIALVDCHNAQSLQLLQARTDDPDDELRQTALEVLGRIGGAAEVGVLIKAVAQNRSAQESALALAALGRMHGPAIDEQLVKALAAAADLELRIKLIRLLASRSAINAVPEILKQAAGPEAKVSVAALSSLQSLAGTSELSALVALTRDARDPSVREAAESAVAGACTRTGSTFPGTEAVLVELKHATDPSVKNSWVNILVSLGEAKGLPAVLAAVNDPNEAVAGNALEQLGRWPDPGPVDTLLGIVQKNADPSRRKRALGSAIQLAKVAAEERQRPVGTLVKWFKQLNDGATSGQERRLIISGLGRVTDPESLRMLIPYLEDPDLREEAAVAIVQIAPALPPAGSPALKEALEKIASSARSKDLRDEASKIGKSIPN